MLGMALQPLSVEELADTRTLFASFMGYIGRSPKTFGQLLAIYRERSKTLHAAEDRADDLRVDRFMDDMASDRWNAAVVIRSRGFNTAVARAWYAACFNRCSAFRPRRRSPCGFRQGRGGRGRAGCECRRATPVRAQRDRRRAGGGRPHWAGCAGWSLPGRRVW